MTAKSATKLTLVKNISLPALQACSKHSRAAIKRCCAAWQRSFDACLEGKEVNAITRAFTINAAGPAFYKAMPPLAGQENICDYIACAAHGILINAIPEKRANQLLYAAQVVLSSLNRERKSGKSACTPTPPSLWKLFFASPIESKQH